MDPKTKEILLGIFAIVLLLIYAITLGNLVLDVWQHDPNSDDFTVSDGIIWTINIIGGLVSAVIISNLAKAEPGNTPRSQVAFLSETYGRSLLDIVIWIYFIAWIFVGLGAFLIGVIYYPLVCDFLNQIGKAWMGILVGAAYAWFGVDSNVSYRPKIHR